MFGTQAERTKGMKIQAQELIDQAYKRGFKDGYDKHATDAKDVRECAEHEAYHCGLDDAWECARKIVNAYTHANAENPNGLHKVFGDYLTAYTFDMSPSEAIEKIKAWEQKKAEEEEKELCEEAKRKVEALAEDIGLDQMMDILFKLNGGEQ